MRAFHAILLGAILLWAMPGAGVQAVELTSQQLAAKAQDSLVFIATRYFDANTGQTKTAGSGSGFVITDGGLVLTAYHVVKDWNAQSDEDKQNNPLRIRLGSSHGDEVDAGIVGINEQYDVALLQILRPGTYNETGVCFATTLEPGEAVTGFGFPDGLERQSSPGTFGNASADNGRWAVSFNNAEGMSGGPLYDQFGDVVGIIRGTYGGQGASNVVTPVRRAKGLIDDLVSFKEECLRDAPAEPLPAAADDWYGGSLWKNGDDQACEDVKALLGVANRIGLLHDAETGERIAKFRDGAIKENLLFTVESANEPQCVLETVDTGAHVVDCMLDISQSKATFSEVFASAASEIGKCLKPLKYSLDGANPDCAAAEGGSCFYAWQRAADEAHLYGFSSGDPVVYGLGLYASVTGK